jgi:hypothetical protein|tara:strand:+ start:14614 stop:14952 length:339 start_codon:yes stop_codon:yes gene_type:complete
MALKVPLDYLIHRSFRSKPSVKLDWVATKTPFSIEYEIKFRLSSESEWSLAGFTTDITYDFFSMIPGEFYDYRVTAISGGFVRSDPLELLNQQTQEIIVDMPRLRLPWWPGK